MNVTNKTKQNRNRRDNNVEEDEYVYPTAKVRETKTRDRRSGKNQIRKGLIDLENSSFDEFKEEAEDSDWYDDTPMASDEDIAKEFGDIADPQDLFNPFDILDNVNTDWDHRWEDY